jgi:hypothetical protein
MPLVTVLSWSSERLHGGGAAGRWLVAQRSGVPTRQLKADLFSRGVTTGDLCPNSKEPFDMAAVFKGCPKLPPHLQHLLQAEQQAHAQLNQLQGAPQLQRASWGADRPRMGLSKSRSSGQSSYHRL